MEQFALTKQKREDLCAQIPSIPVTEPADAVPSPDIHHPPSQTSDVHPVVQGAPKAPETFTPPQDNTLFWCVFISHYGYADYLKIGNKYSNAEIEEKQTILDTLSKSPRTLKDVNHKLTNQMLQELYSALMVNKRDDLFTCIAFSAYYYVKIYVVFPHNNTYLVYIPPKNTEREDAPPLAVIQCKVGARKNIYSLEMHSPNQTLEKVAEIEAKFVCLESWNKPLKGASAYKLPELTDMATKLGVEISKAKKGELYEKIAEVCSLERVLQNQ